MLRAVTASKRVSQIPGEVVIGTFNPAQRRSNLIAELKECNNLERVKAIHDSAIQTADDANVYVASTLVRMYSKCGSMQDARHVFDRMDRPNVVSWTALMLGYADNGEGETALDLFVTMSCGGCAPDARSFVAAIKACTTLECSSRGRTLQLLACSSGCDSQPYVEVTLVDMYAKCKCMIEAQRVFDSIKDPTVVAWNALIMGYAENGEELKSLVLFSRLGSESCEPNSRTFVAATKACAELVMKEGNLDASKKLGQVLHLLSLRNSSNSDVYLQDTLLDLYAKCLSMNDAYKVFENMENPTVVSWNALIMGYAENGDGTKALHMFSIMERHCEPNSRTFVAALKACIELVSQEDARTRGKLLHLLSLRNGCGSDSYVQGTLVDMYAKLGTMENAHVVFNSMSRPSLVSWTALISGYADNGEVEIALTLFSRMKREGFTPDSRILVSALKACSELVYSKIVKIEVLNLIAVRSGCDSDIYVQGILVDMYAKCGIMENSRRVFESMKHADVASWNALILGYVENGEGPEALDLFSKMTKHGCTPNGRSLVAALKACIELTLQDEESANTAEYIRRGRIIHLLAFRFGYYLDIFLQATLVDMYAKCKSMGDTFSVLESIEHPNVVAWTAGIFGYAENGEGEAALCLFSKMRTQGCAPNARTFVAVLKACTANVDFGRGEQVHLLASLCGYDTDIFVLDTLVDMYGKCGSMENAQILFNGIKHPNVVTWNALLFGYVDNGEGKTALDLFSKMKRQGYAPDERTYVAALKACGTLGALHMGAKLHDEISSRGLEGTVLLGNCLVDFYAKCGSLTKAQHVFDVCGTRNLICWTALMAGYSKLGNTREVFSLFEKMCDIGLQPNDITFLCVLTACSHAGLVERGKDYFKLMSRKYGIRPGVEHNNCMVDILGRANKLDEAMALLSSMPFSPDEVAWMTLLGACRKWKNLEIGRLAFESLMGLEDKPAAAFVLMANIYGSKGMWKDQEALQAIRKRLGIWKKPGQSLWTSQTGVVHTFLAGDKSHPQTQEMDKKLKEIVLKMKEHGYVADLSSVTGNLSNIEKEDALCGHSERLAIACALINTSPGESIRIIKNLRVCVDCHAATALISQIEQRTIVCRDASRFHVFENGKCICNNFW